MDKVDLLKSKKDSNKTDNKKHHIYQVISWDALGFGENNNGHKTGLTATDFVLWIWFRFLVNSHANKDMLSFGYVTRPVNTTDITRILGIPKRTIHSSLARLREKGYIETKRIYQPGNLIIRLLKLPETNKTNSGYCKIDIENFVDMVKNLKSATDVKILIATYIHYLKHCKDVSKIYKCFMAKKLHIYRNRIFQSFRKLQARGYFKANGKGVIQAVHGWKFYNQTSLVNLFEFLGIKQRDNLKNPLKLNRHISLYDEGLHTPKVDEDKGNSAFCSKVNYAILALRAMRDKAFKGNSMVYMLKYLQYAISVNLRKLEGIISGDWQLPGGKNLNPYHILCVM